MNNSSVGSLPQRPMVGVQFLGRLLPIALVIVLANGRVFFLGFFLESRSEQHQITTSLA